MLLITGCCGFIGTNLCYKLTQLQSEEIVGLDALLLGKETYQNITALKMNFECVDLRDYEAVQKVFSRYPITKIVHLAAESHVDRSITNPLGFWQSNVIGTANLMHCAMNAKVQLVINQITDEAYGEKPIGEALEGDKFAPTSPYPCSKVAQYWVGKSYATTYGLPVISTFPVNCYGPWQQKEKLIPRFITNLLENKQVPLMKSSHFERDWLPVDNMCDAHIKLLESGVIGEDYNVGANNHHTNLALTKKLLQLCQKDESFIKVVEDRKAHDCRYAVNADKLKNLSWRLTHNFDDYLQYTVEWYKTRC